MPYPTRQTRAKIIRFLAILSFVYLAAIATLVLSETTLLFMPIPGDETPKEAGLDHYERKLLDTGADMLPITYWENTAPADAPVVFYFHGNAGGLGKHNHKDTLAWLDQAKFHVIALEYPGYSGAAGSPSELSLVNSAIALYDARAAGKTAPAIWGYSLGSGVAVQLAARRHPSALVLEAPFTAVVDRAEELFPYAPVSLLMKNQFRSRDYIRDIDAPLLIIHGDSDGVIPIRHGRNLYAMAAEPKAIHEFKGYGHINLIRSGAYDDAATFIRVHAKEMQKEATNR